MQINNFKSINYIKYLLIILPPIWGLYMVYEYGVNVVYYDEWTWIFNADNWSWEWIFRQHNEHRMLFPTIIAKILGNMSGWNSKWHMYASQVILLGYYFVTIKVLTLNQKIKSIGVVSSLQIFIVGMCIYSSCQYENITWGFQTAWFMIAALGVASFYLFGEYIKNDKRWQLFASVVCAFICSFCSLHGQTIWFAYMTIFFMGVISGEKLPMFGVKCILATSAVSLFAYFYHWHFVSYHAKYSVTGFLPLIKFFLKGLGMTMLQKGGSFTATIGVVILVCLICILFLHIKRRDVVRSTSIVGPILMGCGMILIMAIGRSGAGSGDYVPSRYMTSSLLLVVYLIVDMLLYGDKNYSESIESFISQCKIVVRQITNILLENKECVSRLMTMIIVVTFSVLVLRNNYKNISKLDSTKDFQLYNSHILVDYDKALVSDLIRIYPALKDESQETLNEFLKACAFLKENKYNAFEDFEPAHSVDIYVPQTSSKGMRLSVENMGLNNFFKYGAVYKKDILFNVSGWAYDEETHRPLKNVYLKLDSDYFPTEKQIRKDIAKRENNSALKECGFSGWIATENLSEGEHTVSVLGERENGEWCEREIRKFIVVGNEETREQTIARFRKWDYGTPTIDNDMKAYLDTCSLSPAKPLTLYEYDGRDGKESFTIGGWAYDRNKGKLFLRVYAHIADRYFDVVTWERADVAKAFSNNNIIMSGYSADIYTMDLPAGDYPLSIIGVDDDGNCYEKVITTIRIK